MSKNSDWFPRPREAQLAMAKDWAIVLHTKGAEWGVTDAQITALQGAASEAENALLTAKNEMTRTPVATAKCKQTFGALEDFMRGIKKRHFFEPPLTDADMISLSLKPHDSTPTTVPVPEAQAEADLTFPGIHLVQLKNIRAVSGTGDDRSDYGARVYWGLTGPSRESDKFRLSSPPATGNDLPHSTFTRRKKELFDFDGESGNTVYFCLRFENGKGEAGPFGPILHAVIP